MPPSGGIGSPSTVGDHRMQKIHQMKIEDSTSAMKINLSEHRESSPLHSFGSKDPAPLDTKPHSIVSFDGAGAFVTQLVDKSPPPAIEFLGGIDMNGYRTMALTFHET